MVPFLLIILQLRQMRLTDALTFIPNSDKDHNRPGNLVPLKLAFFIKESYC
jgi:hypothetical protein